MHAQKWDQQGTIDGFGGQKPENEDRCKPFSHVSQIHLYLKGLSPVYSENEAKYNLNVGGFSTVNRDLLRGSN